MKHRNVQIDPSIFKALTALFLYWLPFFIDFLFLCYSLLMFRFCFKSLNLDQSIWKIVSNIVRIFTFFFLIVFFTAQWIESGAILCFSFYLLYPITWIFPFNPFRMYATNCQYFSNLYFWARSHDRISLIDISCLLDSRKNIGLKGFKAI